MSAPGAVVLRSAETVAEPWLAAARSGLPSPLRSPMATEWGFFPEAKVCCEAKAGAVAAGAVVLCRTAEALAEFALATARSGLPSPLRSPMATKMGFDAVAKV